MAGLTFSAAVIQETAKLIEERIDELKNNLTNRGAVTSFDAYNARVGQIEGLRMALELCDEAVRKLNES